MEFQPISGVWTDLLQPCSLSDLQRLEPLSSLPTRMNLAEPYPYYGIAFGEPLHRCVLSSRDLVIFGRDLGGYYAADADNGAVCYLHMDDGEAQILLANTSLEAFFACHNRFMEYVKLRAAREMDADEASEILDHLLRELDPAAMKDEESFWPMRIYELSEDFFPLDASRLALHQRLYD
ncbi:hypothetical protein B9G55_21790 [Saccharibacillus sp. O16]|nr:hypothetical protein B9G55_21790 [Saccharibacillus sp. O16]